MSHPAANKVEDIIAKHAAVIFSKSYCPYCVKAIKTLTSIAEDSLFVIQLDQVSDGEELHQYIKQKTHQNTVPAIFIKQQFIGGNSNLQEIPKDELIKKIST